MTTSISTASSQSLRIRTEQLQLLSQHTLAAMFGNIVALLVLVFVLGMSSIGNYCLAL